MKTTTKSSGFFAALKGLMMVMFFTFTGVNGLMAAEKAITKEQTEARVTAIQTRVAEIQAMDMNHMSRAERKEIRNELKDMKKELNQHPTYIYISGAGLILLIILLLILL